MNRISAFTQEQQKFIALQELNQKKLQDELQDHIDGLTKQRAEISGLQNENDRFAAEVISLNTQVQNQLEELKLKEMELFDFKKRVTSTDAKIKLQSAMFEQVSFFRCVPSKFGESSGRFDCGEREWFSSDFRSDRREIS